MECGLISKIQSYSTKDGPGLRTTVFMMGCNLKCKWCANPENMLSKKRVFYFKEKCKKCGTCVMQSHGAIQLTKDGCIIDRDKIDLTEMVPVCPYNAYELIGKEMTVDELVQKLLRDKEFYEFGHGGVTFSGGEAGLQADFLVEVMRELKKHQIHICLDTAGLLNSEKLNALLEYVDIILYDIKAFDEQIHMACTDVSNQVILENAKKISEQVPMIIRMVIVPGYNDQMEDIKKRIDFVASLDQVIQVDFLKYHTYGMGKYQKLSVEYPIKDNKEVSDDLLDEVISYAQSKGLKVTIGG
ncbi:MAG: glycyl-radical enzyme activating protein [Erysipelotrichaceae bacterium]|nr:glycyl-radical enzyme activating protein [Erysipelotrichaceae bacterium]